MDKLWRLAAHSIHSHLKSIFLSPLKPSFSSSSSSSSSSFSPRTLTTLSLFLCHSRHLSPPKTPIFPQISDSTSFNFCNLAVVRCFSSVSPLGANTFEWNEPISSSVALEPTSFSENDDDGDVDPRPYIPVRAFFFSTRFFVYLILHFLDFFCFSASHFVIYFFLAKSSALRNFLFSHTRIVIRIG